MKQYQLLERLSSGHACDTYDAWSEERGCRVIVRVATDRRHRRDLVREGRLLQRLTHPNIVRAYETHRSYVVLETLSGSTLAALGRLERDDAIEMGRQLCSAIGYLHRQGWLHLDLKPDNLIADRGRLKVIDLSIAQPPGRIEPGTGTRRWMAPEQERGGYVTEKTDVWGIGAVLRWAGLDCEACLREDPAERPSVEDVIRWLDVKALVRSCAAHPGPPA
jgi:eukaryotic-like serine/threonine-protein kinase